MWWTLVKLQAHFRGQRTEVRRNDVDQLGNKGPSSNHPSWRTFHEAALLRYITKAYLCSAHSARFKLESLIKINWKIFNKNALTNDLGKKRVYSICLFKIGVLMALKAVWLFLHQNCIAFKATVRKFFVWQYNWRAQWSKLVHVNQAWIVRPFRAIISF